MRTDFLLLLLLCFVLAAPIAAGKAPKREVFVYYYRALSPDAWRSFDWAAFTTLCLADGVDAEDADVIAAAHAHGVKVSLLVTLRSPPLSAHGEWRNATARAAWVGDVAALVRRFGLDGVNTDIESGEWVSTGGWAATEFSALHSALRSALGAASQVSAAVTIFFDIVFDRTGAAPRYPVVDMASTSCDFVVFMAYDMQCTLVCTESHANSNLTWIDAQAAVLLGKWGMPAAQTVMALPWYAYDYPATWSTPVPDTPCPHEGCLCRGEFEIPFKDIAAHNETPYSDEPSAELFFDHFDGAKQQWKQTWFDDAGTLGRKITMVNKRKLLGVAIFGAEKLEYDPKTSDTIAMWKQLYDVAGN